MPTRPPWSSALRPLLLGLLTLGLAGILGAWGARRYVYKRLEPVPLADLAHAEGVGSHDPQVCATCHPDIYAEWSASRMGRAFTEPLFQADYLAQGEPFWCLRCHAPLPVQQPQLETGLASFKPLKATGPDNPDFDPDLQAQGVLCVVCHLEDGAMTGPIADPVGAPHPTRHEAGFDAEAACTRCHQLAAPPFTHLDRPLSDTVGEWSRWKEATGRSDSCASCHMPEITRAVAVGGPVREGRQHTFVGAWDDALLTTALSAEASWDTPGLVVVRLTNEAGHNLPTGEPARALHVELQAWAGADPVHTATTTFARRIPLPRLRDQGDDTLLPGETRVIELELPTSRPLDRVEVAVIFDRVWAHGALAGLVPPEQAQVELARIPPPGTVQPLSAGHFRYHRCLVGRPMAGHTPQDQEPPCASSS